jgi:glycosyltransferase involved in cell wall biosynthesis
MRIALFHNLPSGGAKRALYEMVRRLVGEHTIDVFTLSSANMAFGDIRPFVHDHRVVEFTPRPLLGSPFGRLNQAIRWSYLRRLRGVTAVIAEEIRRGGYDLLFAHPCQFEKCSSVVQFVDVPVVYFCQEPLRILYEETPLRPYDGQESGRRRLLNKIDPLPKLYFSRLQQVDRENTQRADRVLVNSEFMRGVVGGIYGVEAQVSYLGVNLDEFAPQRLPRQDFLFSVGSLTPMKGFDFLVQAVGAIPSAERPSLVIANNFQNADEKAFLLALASELAVDLQLLVNVSEERLVTLYNQAAAVAYTPVREPFGLVPLEAMACETAVVAVREGGTVETIVHGKTGLLVERDVGAFASALRRLLGDAALRTEMGRNGRIHVEQNWTWEQAARRVEAHLAETANGAGRPRPDVNVRAK